MWLPGEVEFRDARYPGVAGLSINFNLAEHMGLRWLSQNQSAIAQSLERLSTGKKLNRASDDPAGFTASENLKSDQRKVLAKIDANQRENIRFSAIDGALSVVQDLMTSLNTDIVLAANSAGLSPEDKIGLQTDVNSIVDTLGDLANTTVFNGEQILQPYIGASARDGSGQNLAGSLGALRTGGKFNLISGDLEGAQAFVQGLASSITGARAAAGSNEKRLQVETNALMVQNENLSSAISQIVDTDYASEVGAFVRSQTLAEAATFAVKAARSMQAETVLALIRNQPILKVNPLSDGYDSRGIGQ
jgi:flagellin